jgi:hypothetical protein
LEHQGQCSGQPLKKISVRMPGPSCTVEFLDIGDEPVISVKAQLRPADQIVLQLGESSTK